MWDDGGMSPDQNGNGVPPIGRQMPDQPEHSAQDHRLRRSGGIVGRDIAGAQEGRASAAEMRDGGDRNSRDTAEM